MIEEKTYKAEVLPKAVRNEEPTFMGSVHVDMDNPLKVIKTMF